MIDDPKHFEHCEPLEELREDVVNLSYGRDPERRDKFTGGLRMHVTTISSIKYLK